MTSSNSNCSCPSGDGSLQHPCPMHPASTNELKLGDVISVFSCHLESKNDWFVIRLCDQNDVDNYTNHIKENKWQRGIHPSLIPDGWQLVPIEPTDEMRYAASWACGIGGDLASKQKYAVAYKAMLEKAPKPEDKQS